MKVVEAIGWKDVLASYEQYITLIKWRGKAMPSFCHFLVWPKEKFAKFSSFAGI